jgi:hypothetical protein
MRLVIYGMFCAGLAGLHVYGEFDKRVNYQPVDARVSAVDEQCYMEKKEDAGKWTSDLLPCEVAALLTRDHRNGKVTTSSTRSRFVSNLSRRWMVPRVPRAL